MKYGSKLRNKKNKSGKESCEICKESCYLQAHHIEGRKVKNANNPHNLCNICPNCHEKVHRGDIVIEGRFMTSAGEELFWHHVEEESFTGEEKKTFLK